MSDGKVTKAKLTDLKPDQRNANKGSERGAYMLEHSLREYGAGRSVLVDKHGNIIAGNKTVEEAANLGLEEVVIVETDGSKLVAVKRTDLDLYDGDKARKLAYADNRVQDVSLTWDADSIVLDLADGLDLSDMFFDDEIAVLTAELPGEDEWGDAFGALPDGERAPFQQMTFTLHDMQAEQVKAALKLAKGMGDFVDSPNENSNGNALARIVETYLTDYGQG